MFQRFFERFARRVRHAHPRAIFLLAGVIGIASLSTSQASPRQLMATINGEKPIQLQGLQIDSEISGGMAETTVRMVFYNPNKRPLEGNLQFPLLPAQQITSFSLDINAQMHPAVPVEKQKGRQVFEEIERRRVDPAILEVTQGNNFKLRVFPVPAGGTRTVQLTYAEAMSRRHKNWVYQLPLGYDDELKNFAWTLNVNGSKAEPQISGGLRDVKAEKNGNAYRAQVDDVDFAQNASVTVMTRSESESRAYTQERSGETYFMAEVPVPVERFHRALPKVVGILWDSSGSGAARQINAELNELNIYFKALGNADVRLTRLRDHAEATQVFHVRDGNWDELRKSLKQTVYDGASALGDWKPDTAVGEYLLFSDGLINYGAGSFPVLSKTQRLYALNSALVADTGWLAAQAERTGGRLIPISEKSPGAAAEELLTEGAHLVDMDAVGATDLYAESADPQQGLLRIAGKLTNRDADLNLTISSHGQLRTIHVPVSANAPKHPLAAHFWARYRLHMLEGERDLKRAEIRRIGQQFGIPTAETSLIVLESVDDYVRYDIPPPADYQAAFDQLRNTHAEQSRQQNAQHLDSVLQLFQAKVAWWEKDFPKDDPRKPEPVAVGNVGTQARAVDGAVMAQPAPAQLPAAPRPVPPPPPASAPLALSSDSVQRVEITGTNIRRADVETAEPIQAITMQNVAATGGLSYRNTAQRAPASTSEPGAPRDMTMTLKKWTSDAPYIARMKAASKDEIYAIYLDEKPSYSNSSAFFLDAADMLLEKGERDLALRVLSNLAEMDLENRQVLRILGYRLMEMDAAEQAIPIFEKVLRLAEDEPQSFRDLGLANAAAKHYQNAIDQLNEVVMRSWDMRFPDIEIISLAELNAIVATQKAAGNNLDTSRIDPRLLKNLPLDLRVVMTWDADNSDMDLWVTDPVGEKCFYGHPLTYQGGRMSRDVTQGYGPEEFSLRIARPGKYKVEANFFGNRQQVVAGATTVQVKLSTGFGTAKARDQMVTLRLKDRGETVFVGEFEIKP